MATFLIILSCLLFVTALGLVSVRITLAPVCAYLGLLTLSFATTPEGYPVVPINSTILFGWLCMTIIVMVATIMQAPPLRRSKKGTGYILIGALTGLAVGLLGFSFASTLSLVYGIMIVATAAGCFFGFLLYTNTPEGQPMAIRSGNFYNCFVRYFLAKAFPIAITVMQMGVVAVLLIAVYQNTHS